MIKSGLLPCERLNSLRLNMPFENFVQGLSVRKVVKLVCQDGFLPIEYNSLVSYRVVYGDEELFRNQVI